MVCTGALTGQIRTAPLTAVPLPVLTADTHQQESWRWVFFRLRWPLKLGNCFWQGSYYGVVTASQTTRTIVQAPTPHSPAPTLLADHQNCKSRVFSIISLLWITFFPSTMRLICFKKQHNSGDTVPNQFQVRPAVRGSSGQQRRLTKTKFWHAQFPSGEMFRFRITYFSEYADLSANIALVWTIHVE